MKSAMSRAVSSTFGLSVVVAAAYYLVAELCLRLAQQTTNVTAIWPPTGIALAAVLLFGFRICPAIAVGAFFANLETFIAFPLPTPFAVAGAAATAAGNTLGAVVSGFLVLRFTRARNPFDHPGDIARFVLFGALAGTNASAVIGAVTLALLGGSWSQVTITWFTWWIGDAVADLIITPIIMTWEGRRRSWTRLQVTEAAALVGSFLLIGWIVFDRGLPLPYLFMPLLIWSAFRFGKFEGACLILIMLCFSIWGSVSGIAIYHDMSTRASLLLTQVFISIASIVTMLLIALIAERDAALASLRRSHARLLEEVASRLQTEDELRESEGRFKLFMQHFPGLVYIKDVTSRILFANRRFMVDLGIDPAGMIGKKVDEVFPPDTAQKILAEDRHVMAAETAETTAEYEEVIAGRTWLTHRFLIPMGHREPLLGGISVDVTERREAEKEKARLDAQNRQLQKAESLSRMAGAIAHLFNNQLTTVLGHLDLILFKTGGEFKLSKNLSAARQAASRAADISLLMLTYLGHAPGVREPLDLSEACSHSIPLLRATISTELPLEADLPLPGPVIRANPSKIQLLLMNLVTNAWESMAGQGGPVHLKVTTADSGAIAAGRRFPVDWEPGDDGYACLEVADHGCGIAEEHIDKLFDPFFSSKFVGRGMGLPTVLGIVRAHSGVVTVETEQGHGSVFRVYLPLSAT